MPHSPKLSICMIVKNEEKNLPTVLSSVEGLADEIIVVDTGSQDKTIEVAERYGAKVYYFNWCNDFSAARNESLKYATGNYILWLDADDEIPKEDIPVIRRHLREYEKSAVYLKLQSMQGDDIAECAQLRIFPNFSGIQFEGKAHEQVYYSVVKNGLLSSYCNARVIHRGYENQEIYIGKLKRNIVLLEEMLQENPDDMATLVFLAVTVKSLNRKKECLEYLDRAIAIGRHDAGDERATVHRVAFLEKAGILSGNGRQEEAISALKSCLEKFPNDNLAKFLLGEIYCQTKDYRNARAMLLPLENAKFENGMIPVNPVIVEGRMHKYLGISSLYEGDFKTAAESLSKAVDITCQDATMYHYLALSREKLDDFAGAIVACRDALKRFPEDNSLAKRLFLLLMKNESFEEAAQVYETLNGYARDTEVVTAMFFMQCRKMDLKGMMDYYALLQDILNISREPFPEGFALVRGRLENKGEPKSLATFDSAISFLLKQYP